MKFFKSYTIFILMFVFGLLTTSCSAESSNDAEVLVDAEQFAEVSSEELISILGEPYDVDTWNFISPNSNEYPANTYFYNNDNGNVYEFLIIDDKVVRFTFWSPKYNDRNANDISYNNKQDIIKMFGITDDVESKISADTNFAIRYNNPTEKIDDFWVPIMNDNVDTFNCVKITYANEYFN